MLILALDSCGAACNVCLWQEGRILSELRENMQRGQDARLMPMIVSALEMAGHTFFDLDRLAVTRGPGSFTGVRVGLAAAHGIGLASHKPVLGIDRFAIYHALHQDGNKNLLVVIDSKRTEYFCKYFPATGAAQDPQLMTQKGIDDFLAAHPGTKIAGDLATPEDNVAAACAKIASAANPQNPDFQALPLYLRPPDVTFPTAKSR